MSASKSLHEKIRLFYKLAFFGDRSDFLKAAQGVDPAGVHGLVPQLSPQLQKAPEMHGGQWSDAPKYIDLDKMPTVNVEDLPKAEQAPAAKPMPAIPVETQDQLNQLLVPGGHMMPLKLDGKLGPETAKAVQLFKDKYHRPATPNAIKETYMAEKNPGLETKFPT